MNKIYKLLAVFMLFAALSAGSMTVQAGETDAVAQIGETTYPSLDAAITNAGTNTEVEIDLLEAVELKDAIIINSNVTLDLNGCTLTTSSSITVAPGGNVVDNSETKSGLLKLGDSGTITWTTNSQVPVYNTEKEGYAFATMTEQVYRKSERGADTFELIFKPDFGALNDLMAKGSIATKVDIGVNLEWTDAKGTSKTAQLVYTEDMDDMVQTVYTANSGKAFLLTATGANSFDNLTITPMVKSKLGTEWSDSEVNASVYHKVDLTTMAEGDVVKRTVGTITEQAAYTGEQATVKVIADATEGRFIRIDDSSTASTGYPGFQVSNIDFSSGVKVIEFDMRINAASGGTAVKVNVIGATNLGNAHAISLEMGKDNIRYYSGSGYVFKNDVKATSDCQWKKVVLTVDSDNDKFSLSYGGVPVFENANLRGDADLNGKAALIIWTNGTTTSNVDIKNIVVTNGVR